MDEVVKAEKRAKTKRDNLINKTIYNTLLAVYLMHDTVRAYDTLKAQNHISKALMTYLK